LENGENMLTMIHISVNKTAETRVTVQTKIKGLQAQMTDATVSIIKLEQSVTKHSAKPVELYGWADDDDVTIKELKTRAGEWEGSIKELQALIATLVDDDSLSVVANDGGVVTSANGQSFQGLQPSPLAHVSPLQEHASTSRAASKPSSRTFISPFGSIEILPAPALVEAPLVDEEMEDVVPDPLNLPEMGP
jgi:hypothetical protein